MTEFPTHTASVEEIFAYAGDRKVGFAHLLLCRKNPMGNTYREFNRSRGKVHNVKGVPMIRHRGMLHPVTATGTTFSTGVMLDFSIVDSLIANDCPWYDK